MLNGDVTRRIKVLKMRLGRRHKTIQENRQALACLTCLTALSMAALAQNSAATGDSTDLKHWSADQLKGGSPGLLLTTRTHLLKLVRVATDSVPESHEGTTD